VEEENEKFILQMRSDFTKCCENSEDVFLLLKKEIHAFLQSAKDETGKSKNFSRVISQVWQTS